MKILYDWDIHIKNGGAAAGHLYRDIVEYASKTDATDILLPSVDYWQMARIFDSTPSLIQGRDDYGMPYFSFAGLKFQMITKEQYQKLKLLQ